MAFGTGREFVLKVVADVKDATKGMDQVASGAGTMRDKVTGVAKSVVTGLAVGAVVQFGKQSVLAASNAQQSFGAMSSVFGDYADEMEKFGDTSAENLGITEQQFNQLSATTGALLKNAGLPMEQVTESTQDLTTRAADLAAMFGTDVSTAVEAMGSAFKGEFDSLEQFGVSLKASDIEARAMAEGYTDAEGKVTDAGKAIAAQEMIMEQSADAAGTFSAEAGTLAGQTQIMTARFADTQAELGTKLLPIIVKVIDAMMPLVDLFLKYADILVPVALGIGAIVLATQAYQAISVISTAATAAWTAAQWLLNTALLANPIGLIVIAVAALVAGFILAYKKIGWFRDAVDKALKGIVTAFNWMLDIVKKVFAWIKKNWPLLLAIITGPIGVATLIIVKNWDKIKAGAKAAFDWVKKNWPLILAIITGPIGAAVLVIVRNWDRIRETFRNSVQRIKDILSNIRDIISNPFKRAFEMIGNGLDRLRDWFRDLPGQIGGWISNLANTITAPFQNAFGAIESLWNNTVGGFGFTVPSWVPGVGGKGFQIPYMAAGGIVTRPTIAMIGESGPEAVIPLGRAGLGATVINVYALTANAEVGRKVYEALNEYQRVSGRRFGAA